MGKRRPPAPAIRVATPADAHAVAEVHVASWRAAYRDLLPASYLDGIDVAERAHRWQGLLTGPEPTPATWVAETADTTLSTPQGAPPAQAAQGTAATGCVVGFVTACPTRDDDEDPAAVGEIPAIYLHPDSWGTGVGRRLMTTALQWLRDRGHRSATLWVLEGNTRARAFYEADGWRPDGAVKRDESRGVVLSEVRYRRGLH